MTAPLKRLGRSPFRLPPGEKLSHHGVRNGCWRFVYRVRRADGTWKSRSFLLDPAPGVPAREQWARARDAGRAFRPELMGSGSAPRRGTGSVRDLLDRWLNHKVVQGGTRPGTLATYRRDLEKHFGDTLLARPLADVTPAVVTDALHVAFLKDGRRTVSARTWNKCTTYLSMMFRFAVRQELIIKSPITEDHRVAEAEGRWARRRAAVAAMPTAAQRTAFLAAAEECEDGTSAGLAVGLGLLTGLRLGELTHLRVRDVTLELGLEDLHVTGGFACPCRHCRGERQLKTPAAERFVPLTASAARAVRAQLARLAEAALDGLDSLLFPVLAGRARTAARPGDPLNPRHVEAVMRTLAAAAGWPALPPRSVVHLLRHVARSAWVAAGLTNEQIDPVLGHAGEGVRAVYTHHLRREAWATFRRVIDGEATRLTVLRTA